MMLITEPSAYGRSGTTPTRCRVRLGAEWVSVSRRKKADKTRLVELLNGTDTTQAWSGYVLPEQP